MATPTPSQTLVTVHPKPKFVFFGMTWCPHCVYFAKGQKDASGKQIMAPQWPIMLADNELKNRVELIHHEWNHKAEDGAGRKMTVIPRPPGYDFINAGPMFLLEAGKDGSGNGIGNIFAGGPRSAADLKKWIFNQLATSPLFQKKGPVVSQQQKSVLPTATAPSRPKNMGNNKPAATPTPVAAKQQTGADKLRAAMVNQQQAQAQAATRQPTVISPPAAANIPTVATNYKKVVDNGGATKTNFTYKQAGTTTRLVANLN
jgi:hypothetical protein